MQLDTEFWKLYQLYFEPRMISIKIEFTIISCIILTSVVEMKVIFLCICLFLFSTISWGRENVTRSHSILSFFNNLMSHQLRWITSGQDSTSVSGFIRDWVGASQYRRGEISFNATVPHLPFHLVASNSSQKPKHWTITLSCMIHFVSSCFLNFFKYN